MKGALPSSFYHYEGVKATAATSLGRGREVARVGGGEGRGSFPPRGDI